jgi:hypothetical protein
MLLVKVTAANNKGSNLVRLTLYLKIGPSGVRALPLAAGINIGGHYKWHLFLSFLLLLLSSFCSLLILTEGVVVGF